MNLSDYKKLNLGSGENPKAGYINVDWQSLTKPDVQHDLNVFPYPFADNTFDYVEAFHVLEHLDKPFLVMKEIHRIMKPDGTLVIRVPHFSRGFTHAEHSHGFDLTFALYFNKNFTKSGYFGVQFELKRLRMRWMAFFHLLPYMGYGQITIGLLKVLSAIISAVANIWPSFCSRVWCYWVGGFEEIEFVLVAKK